MQVDHMNPKSLRKLSMILFEGQVMSSEIQVLKKVMSYFKN